MVFRRGAAVFQIATTELDKSGFSYTIRMDGVRRAKK
jgi:hypothetical protein